MLHRTFLAAIAIAAASPALADATTYSGKLGNIDIVLELSSPIEQADASVVGRYHYVRKGIDIPLRATDAIDGKLVLVEENPCTEEICEPAFMLGTFPDELRGAVWTLETSDGGRRITGTWEAGRGKKPLGIEMDLVGTRDTSEHLTDPLEPAMLQFLPSAISEGKVPLEMSNAPYDFLKSTAVEPTKGEETRWGDVAFRYLTDPRVGFGFPEITALGGADPGAANKRLTSRRALLNTYAFECESTAYLGLMWTPGASNWMGTYGGYPDLTVEVHYLSPTLMSWSEAGSIYCGGAHPSNHQIYTTIDARTGRDLDLTRILADSSQGPYRWVPGKGLVDLVKGQRTKWDGTFEEECGIDQFVESNLAVSFKQGDIAVFALEGLPHAMKACEDVLFEAPLAELRDYLAPTAVEYFSALKQ